MGEDVFKLPIKGIELPKPKAWDLVAVLAVVVGLGAAGAHIAAALGRPPGDAVGSAFTAGMVGLQLAICVGSLLVLGKTAKHGTLWGNLAAVTGMLVGMSGILLAAALWSAA